MTSYCSICESECVVGFVVTKRHNYDDEVDIIEYRCEKHIHNEPRMKIKD